MLIDYCVTGSYKDNTSMVPDDSRDADELVRENLKKKNERNF
jgi:hypothetical protein